MPPGFIVPDVDAPLDNASLRAPLPAELRVRGVVMQNHVDACAAAGVPIAFGPYAPFQDYSGDEQRRVLLAAAAALHPALSTRRALAELGKETYAAIASSRLGRVVFGLLGNDMGRISRRVEQAYALAGRGLGPRRVSVGADHVHVRFDIAPPFVDSYHVGAFRGVLDHCRKDGEVFVRHDGPSAELFLRWRDP